jgi:hypothetical protein
MKFPRGSDLAIEARFNFSLADAVPSRQRSPLCGNSRLFGIAAENSHAFWRVGDAVIVFHPV